MAKQLQKAPPTSSVARLLDLDAAARAVAVNPPRSSTDVPSPQVLPASPPPQIQKAVDNRPRIKRELVLTETADLTLTRLVELYRRQTGTKLTTSHVARALLKGVAHCIDTLEREARRLGPMQLPPNAPAFELERERFEARIADAFVAGIRNAASYDPNDDALAGR